jgi:CheY-like chemotaxis protein
MATILIVEDENNMRLLTSARLEDKYHIVCACNGFEALECVHNGIFYDA